MSDLISTLPQGFLDEFEAEIKGRIPEEKVQAELRQQKIARVMNAVGSVHIPEIGQKIAQIDARLVPSGCGLDGELGGRYGLARCGISGQQTSAPPASRPPKKRGARHGITFNGGKPIGAGFRIVRN
jgi:hypothetical protein